VKPRDKPARTKIPARCDDKIRTICVNTAAKEGKMHVLAALCIGQLRPNVSKPFPIPHETSQRAVEADHVEATRWLFDRYAKQKFPRDRLGRDTTPKNGRSPREVDEPGQRRRAAQAEHDDLRACGRLPGVLARGACTGG